MDVVQTSPRRHRELSARAPGERWRGVGHEPVRPSIDQTVSPVSTPAGLAGTRNRSAISVARASPRLAGRRQQPLDRPAKLEFGELVEGQLARFAHRAEDGAGDGAGGVTDATTSAGADDQILAGSSRSHGTPRGRGAPSWLGTSLRRVARSSAGSCSRRGSQSPRRWPPRPRVLTRRHRNCARRTTPTRSRHRDRNHGRQHRRHKPANPQHCPVPQEHPPHLAAISVEQDGRINSEASWVSRRLPPEPGRLRNQGHLTVSIVSLRRCLVVARGGPPR